MPSAAGIRARFALLLVPLLAGLFATWFFIRQNEHAEAARLLADARQQQTTVLDHWLGATERTLRNFTVDLAQHGPFARLPALSDPAAASAAISRVLANSD